MTEGLQNKSQLKLSEIADSIGYIVLSKDKDVIIGDIGKIQLSDSNIYLISNSQVLRFDFSGKLLNSFGNIGRGPEEYLRGSTYTITPTFDKVLILRSMLYDYLIYKPYGEYIGKKDFPYNRNLYSFASLSDSVFLLTFHYIGTFMNEEYLHTMPGIAGLFDLNCQPVAVIENPLKSTKITEADAKRVIISNSSFTFFDNRIVLTPDGDTIYEIDENSIQPGFIIDWGQIPHKEGAEDLYYMQTGTTNKGKIHKPVIETETKGFYRGISSGNYFLFEYDKTTGHSRSMDIDENKDGFINDLDGGENYFPYYTNRKGDIWIAEEDANIFLKTHSDIMLSKSGAINQANQEKLRAFIANLKIDDNPVLKIVYLKQDQFKHKQ